MTEDELTFYRMLFLKRYTLLLEKVQTKYNIPPETMKILKERILSLDLFEYAIQEIPSSFGES